MKKTLLCTILIIMILLSLLLVGCVTDNNSKDYRPGDSLVSDATLVYEQMAKDYTSSTVTVRGGRLSMSGKHFVQDTYATGFFISNDGYILSTNLIDGSSVSVYRVDVLQSDNSRREYNAVFVKAIQSFRVLKIVENINNDKFNCLPIDDNSGIIYGAPALVVSDPFDYGLYVTRAMVSMPDFPVTMGWKAYDGFTIDAPTSKYSIGAPVISRNGKNLGVVIGRNESSYTDTSGIITYVYDITYVIKASELSAIIELALKN